MTTRDILGFMKNCQFCDQPLISDTKKFCGMQCRSKFDRQNTLAREKTRIQGWLELAKQGARLADIGLKEGVTRERIRQILKRNGINISDFHQYREHPINQFKCNYCHQIFERRVKSVYFCSHDCQGKFMHEALKMGDFAHHPVPSRRFPSKQYRSVYVGMQNGKAVYQTEHRLVMEAHLGRKLLTNEHVTHLDGNGLNNKIENLKVVSASDHASQVNGGWAKDLKVQFIGRIWKSKH